MLWGVLLVLAGLGLLGGQGWARWFTIILVGLNFFAQLGFLGNSKLPALGADGPDAQRDRPLRADGAVETRARPTSRQAR